MSGAAGGTQTRGGPGMYDATGTSTISVADTGVVIVTAGVLGKRSLTQDEIVYGDSNGQPTTSTINKSGAYLYITWASSEGSGPWSPTVVAYQGSTSGGGFTATDGAATAALSTGGFLSVIHKAGGGGGTTGTITIGSDGSSSYGQILASSGTPASGYAHIARQGDTDTGLKWTGADALGIWAGNTAIFSVTQTTAACTVPIDMPTNGGGNYWLRGVGDSNTGVYWDSADNLRLYAGGIPYIVTNSALIAYGYFQSAATSSVTAPDFSFYADTNTGFYSIGADNIGVTAGGVKRVDISTVSCQVVSTATVASAGAATWNGFYVLGSTLTLTGTTTVTELALVRFGASTVTDSSAVTVTDAATVAIDDAPTTGGSVTITNKWALLVKAGASKLVGNLTVAPGGTTKFALNTTGVGFFNTTPAAQQTSGANLTNNVTSGGTTDQVDTWSNLTTYSTDAAAIRNAVYQLARKLKQVNDGLRVYGLLT